MDSQPGTLDAHLKQFIARATGGWVAVVLERAHVVEIDRSRPARVRLSPDWQGPGNLDGTERDSHAARSSTPIGRTASRTDRSNPADVHIGESVSDYRSQLTPSARYASFDYCYNYFQSFHERDAVEALADENHLQTSCLQLGFYLASWGMLRGSSTLLQRSARNFVPVVHAIAQMPRGIWSIDANNYSHENCEALIDAVQRVHRAYPDAASDTLVTKTMLGVFGCVPAFDQYFKNGFRVSSLSTRALEKIGRYYDSNAASIDSNRTRTIDFDTGQPTRRLYPRAKVIDMVFFVAGGGSRR